MAKYIPLPDDPHLLKDIPRENWIEYCYRAKGHWVLPAVNLEMLNFLAKALVDPKSMSFQDYAVIEKLREELNG